jgi:hypothetical protein
VAPGRGISTPLGPTPPPHARPQVIYLSGPAAPGLQTKLKQVFHDLNVDVKRHDVNGGVDSGTLEDVFYVKGPKGKLTDSEISKACTVLEGIVKTQAAVAHSGVRPKFQTQTIAPDPAKREVLYAIMGERRPQARRRQRPRRRQRQSRLGGQQRPRSGRAGGGGWARRRARHQPATNPVRPAPPYPAPPSPQTSTRRTTC